ncbi:cation/H(+) antiporter 15-like [Impatiens glandulifera]|uniref:cation/H(+) antiporter 15-like n=1 Tax=Impatiens glandulifera TaxID=253017 RepID=UPI001FB135CF|nr:cation/H(+) antiporter 15-like [Impatiens glandulifera]
MTTPNITGGSATPSFAEQVICYAPLMIDSSGVWQNENPMDFSIPLFLFQWMLVIILSRLMAFILKPLRQPRIMSELIGGLMVGPSFMGGGSKLGKHIFPPRSFLVFDTMANVGLLFFLFLLGLEMDISVLGKSSRRVVAIAVGGLLVPLFVLCGFSFILHHLDESFKLTTFMFFVPLALSVTAFPVLARMLAELKLLHVEIGRVAISSALVCDYCIWVLLIIGISLGTDQTVSLSTLWILISGVIIGSFCLFGIRLAITRWLMFRAQIHGEEDKNFSELTICLVLAGAMLCAFSTDAVGLHFASGAFVYGLAIPNGPLVAVIVDKLEDMVNGYLLPLFFFFSGMKTKMYEIQGGFIWGMLILIIFLAWISKTHGNDYSQHWMGTKCMYIIDNTAYTMMMITAVVTTGIVMPTVGAIYQPEIQFKAHKWRTIESTAFTADAFAYLEILACIHNPKSNVPTILNLVRASHPSQDSLLSLFLLQLIELTNRSSAIHIVQGNPDQQSKNWGSTSGFDHLVGELLGDLEEVLTFASIQTLITVSSYSTIHEDICNVAKDKGIAMILLPFHKQKTVDEEMDTINPKFQMINQQVQANAPCSVGILIDRGSGGLYNSNDFYNIAVLFFGGADDREALSYGLRMSRHQNVNLTIVRFVAHNEVLGNENNEREMDESFIEEAKRHRQQAVAASWRLSYDETVVTSSDQTIEVIGSLGGSYDFFVVGKTHKIDSSVMAGIGEWSDCPELGAIGDLMASPDFKSKASVLVVQQYCTTADSSS